MAAKLQKVLELQYRKNLVEQVGNFLHDLSNFTTQRKGSMLPAIMRCESKIVANLSLLNTGIVNEAGLRFAIGDPITTLLCEFWNLKVCMNRVQLTNSIGQLEITSNIHFCMPCPFIAVKG